MTIVFLKYSSVADHKIMALEPNAVFVPSKATKTHVWGQSYRILH